VEEATNLYAISDTCTIAIRESLLCDELDGLSTSGQLIEAYLEQRKRPPVSSVYDAISRSVRADAWSLWEGVEPPRPFENMYTPELALRLAVDAHEKNEYRDCHCWVLTVDSFRQILDELKRLDLLNFKWVRVVRPEKYQLEFIASFRLGSTRTETREAVDSAAAGRDAMPAAWQPGNTARSAH
jgi:uncharacterized Zn finger protein